MFWIEVDNKNFYTTNIGEIKLKQAKLQKSNIEALKTRAERLKKGWKNVDKMLYYQRLLVMPKIFWTKFISRHHDNSLTEYFGTNKTRKLVSQKYYWPYLKKNVQVYNKGCNICLLSKKIKQKLYGNLQALLIRIY